MRNENDKYKDIFEEVDRIIKFPKDKGNPPPQETDRVKFFRKWVRTLVSMGSVATALLVISSIGSIKKENSSQYDILPYIRDKTISEIRMESQIQLERRQISTPTMPNR